MKREPFGTSFLPGCKHRYFGGVKGTIPTTRSPTVVGLAQDGLFLPMGFGLLFSLSPLQAEAVPQGRRIGPDRPQTGSPNPIYGYVSGNRGKPSIGGVPITSERSALFLQHHHGLETSAGGACDILTRHELRRRPKKGCFVRPPYPGRVQAIHPITQEVRDGHYDRSTAFSQIRPFGLKAAPLHQGAHSRYNHNHCSVEMIRKPSPFPSWTGFGRAGRR